MDKELAEPEKLSMELPPSIPLPPLAVHTAAHCRPSSVLRASMRYSPPKVKDFPPPARSPLLSHSLASGHTQPLFFPWDVSLCSMAAEVLGTSSSLKCQLCLFLRSRLTESISGVDPPPLVDLHLVHCLFPFQSTGYPFDTCGIRGKGQ